MNSQAPAGQSPVQHSLWQAVGGSELFAELVDKFYTNVRRDEVLAPMYAHDDWDAAKWRLQALTITLARHTSSPTLLSCARRRRQRYKT
ncbi:hypothetical protein KJY78_01720 [Canibacter sp. lx-45]|uniref:globin domain-containing protein n=1 Tax=Canibacter zhuwentaonis TaxID=2837491 RepID=UPI001BDD449B|nr:hypothetical protein [Canibacter zhuwentaonis]MBT1035073.1 hypothetical protein [Canibacter zhuwentaonis]